MDFTLGVSKGLASGDDFADRLLLGWFMDLVFMFRVVCGGGFGGSFVLLRSGFGVCGILFF